MSKRPTEKLPSKKKNPNEVLKYSGMVFQILAVLGVAAFIGQKLDAYFDYDKPLLTALLVVIALPVVLYFILKDLL